MQDPKSLFKQVLTPKAPYYMKVGSLTIPCANLPNPFHRLMLKILLGITFGANK